MIYSSSDGVLACLILSLDVPKKYKCCRKHCSMQPVILFRMPSILGKVLPVDITRGASAW